MFPGCSSGWRRSRTRSAAAAVALLFALPTAATAVDPQFRATASPDRVVFVETTELTYRYEVTTGDEPVRFYLVADA